MKYIIGASVGGLFGLGIPLAIDAKNPLLIENDESPRIEAPQHVDESLHTPIENMLILPDNSCSYVSYDAKTAKEQAKECLEIDIPAIPAI
jgi:hypothetical protein